MIQQSRKLTIKALAFSKRGMDLGTELFKRLKEGPLSGAQAECELTRCPEGGLSAWTEEAFRSADALLFIGSCGIAVRAIAPFVKKKTEDPAVIVMDELGT